MNTNAIKPCGLWLVMGLLTCNSAPALGADNPPPGLAVQMYAGVNVTGIVGRVYEIQATTNVNLSNSWRSIASVILAESPQPYVYYDVDSITRPSQFYRALDRGVAPAGMAFIPSSTFIMGDTLLDPGDDLGERPSHEVKVSGFFMDRYEVTTALWNEVRAWAVTNGYTFDNAGNGKAVNHPVHTVNWYDCVKWCNARSQKEGVTPVYYSDAALTSIYKSGRIAPYVKWDLGYRLPTEAEWEKAARGGLSGKRFPWGDTISHNQANYEATTNYVYDVSSTTGFHPTFQTGSQPYTSPAGYFAPNNYGLHDVAGNVWEWCWDWFDVSWYSNGSATQNDTRGPGAGTERVCRGGSWLTVAIGCRPHDRNNYDPTTSHSKLGFRTARSLGP